jgi:hypothetical protein
MRKTSQFSSSNPHLKQTFKASVLCIIRSNTKGEEAKGTFQWDGQGGYYPGIYFGSTGLQHSRNTNPMGENHTHYFLSRTKIYAQAASRR